MEVLQSLFPTLNSSDDERPETRASPNELARRLLVVALDEPDIGSSSQWSDLIVFLEFLLERRDVVEAPWEQFAQSFIEDLLNAVSHGDLPLRREQIDSSLHPESTRVAEVLRPSLGSSAR